MMSGLFENDPAECKEGSEKHYEEHLTCSKETKDMIMNDCIKEFIAHHPEASFRKITQGEILKRIAIYYLK